MSIVTRRTRLLAIAFSAVLVSGCAVPRRTLQDDRGIKSFTVVSMLRENVPVERIGSTVFNNRTEILDQNGELNRISAEVLERRLRVARPAWFIVKSNADPIVLAEKNKNAEIFWKTFTGAVTEELKKTAKDVGADVLFVVIDSTQENARGRGVGVSLHPGMAPVFGIAPVAVVRAHLRLVLVDRDGKEISWGSGGNVIVPASELGLSGDQDLAKLSDPHVSDRVNGAIRKQLTDMLDKAATSMGY